MRALRLMLCAAVLVLGGTADRAAANQQACVRLIAGQHIEVGEVCVSHDGQNLYVTYRTTDGWCIHETHLSVQVSWQLIPQTKKGNPIPGQFEYQGEHDCETEVTYTVPLPLDPNGAPICDLAIAAHAVVDNHGSESFGEETGWGEGEDFPGRNWGMYFHYDACGPPVDPDDREGTITVGFEDLPFDGWPTTAPIGDRLWNDWDYNDWVADFVIYTDVVYDANGDLATASIKFDLMADTSIAFFQHQMHFAAGTFGCTGTYTLETYGNGTDVPPPGLPYTDAGTDIILVNNGKTAVPDPDGKLATLTIVFTTPCSFLLPESMDDVLYDANGENFDPHGGHLFFDPYIIVNDTKNTPQSIYPIHMGDPRVVVVPVEWLPPDEHDALWEAYPHNGTFGVLPPLDMPPGYVGDVDFHKYDMGPPRFSEFWWTVDWQNP